MVAVGDWCGRNSRRLATASLRNGQQGNLVNRRRWSADAGQLAAANRHCDAGFVVGLADAKATVVVAAAGSCRIVLGDDRRAGRSAEADRGDFASALGLNLDAVGIPVAETLARASHCQTALAGGLIEKIETPEPNWHERIVRVNPDQ